MRAILFASAMATTLNGRRARSCVSHGFFSGFFLASPSTECAPTTRMRRQIAVTLFRDRPKLLFAPGRILSRYEPHPGGKITARPKGIRVGHRGGYGARANDADPGDALQSLVFFIRTMLHNEPLLDRANHRLQRLELCCQHDQARTG